MISVSSTPPSSPFHAVPEISSATRLPLFILTKHPTHSITVASEEIARHYRNSVITDGVVYAKMTQADILRLVRTHLFAHVVRMPFGAKHGSYYTQVRHILCFISSFSLSFSLRFDKMQCSPFIFLICQQFCSPSL